MLRRGWKMMILRMLMWGRRTDPKTAPHVVGACAVDVHPGMPP